MNVASEATTPGTAPATAAEAAAVVEVVAAAAAADAGAGKIQSQRFLYLALDQYHQGNRIDFPPAHFD